MATIKHWFKAARLRTLPLSVSGVLLGASLAEPVFYDTLLFWLAIATTIGFQIVSNFANDYGDGIRGTDAERVGEARMVAMCLISAKAMKYGMIVASILSFFTATMLIFMAFGMHHFLWAFVFFNLTFLALWAAIKYTVGKKAYGYSGFGDLFVFLFFGLISVVGTFILFRQSVDILVLLPAYTIGVFSMAVLNLNNLRDAVQDLHAGKKTLVVQWGVSKGKKYHYFLLLSGMLASVIYAVGIEAQGVQWLFALAFVPLLWHIKTVMANQELSALDSELKKVALTTFLFSLLVAVAL